MTSGAATGRVATAILISGRGSNMVALLDAAADPAYPAEIVLVLSNRADAPGLAVAAARGVPTAVVESRGRSREDFEDAMQAVLDRHGVRLVALAGFMRVLTEGFVARWTDRMINIHPSLLPSFQGLHTHARALAAGVKLHGCTVHLVRPGVDDGPILAQAAIGVRDDDTQDTLAARVLAEEHRIYPAALGWLAAGCVRVVGAHAVVAAPVAEGGFASPLPRPLAGPLPGQGVLPTKLPQG